MKSLRFKSCSTLIHETVRDRYQEPSNLLTHAQIAQVLEATDQNRQSVCFTGHRLLAKSEIPALIARVDAQLERCYEHGYRDFFCGGALGFDALAAERVIALRKRHAGVRLIMVIPCSDQAARWKSVDTMRYERLLYAADDIRVLSPFYYDGCMQVRNRYMVDHSSLCICYWRHQKGGTASTVAYAIKQDVTVLNVAMENACTALPCD